MSDPLPNLRHLELLATVLRERNISAAARSHHLTQPAVTQAVAALEKHFGAPLLERAGRGLAPTAAGLRCAPRLQRALDRLAQAIRPFARESRIAASIVRRVTATQLAGLVAAVEAGGIGTAARQAGASRATLYRSIRHLERTLGTALFEPTSHGARPTRDAGRLAIEVRLAMAELAQARAEVADASGGKRGSTVIGAMPLARSGIVPAAVLRFVPEHPLHAVLILDGPYESMLEALRDGRADVLVGALRDPIPGDVLQEHLFDDPLTIVARRDHPLRRIRPITVGRLLEYPWVAPRAGSPLRQHFNRLMAAGDARPPAAPIECNSLIAARELLLSSDRLMLLSAQQVRFELEAGRLIVLPHPFGRVTRAIGLTVRREWLPTPAQELLLDLIRAESARAHRPQEPPVRRRHGSARHGSARRGSVERGSARDESARHSSR